MMVETYADVFSGAVKVLFTEEEDKKAGCFSRPVLLLREEDDSDSPSAMLSDPRYQGRKI